MSHLDEIESIGYDGALGSSSRKSSYRLIALGAGAMLVLNAAAILLTGGGLLRRTLATAVLLFCSYFISAVFYSLSKYVASANALVANVRAGNCDEHMRALSWKEGVNAIASWSVLFVAMIAFFVASPGRGLLSNTEANPAKGTALNFLGFVVMGFGMIPPFFAALRLYAAVTPDRRPSGWLPPSATWRPGVVLRFGTLAADATLVFVWNLRVIGDGWLLVLLQLMWYSPGLVLFVIFATEFVTYSWQVLKRLGPISGASYRECWGSQDRS